MKYVSFVLALVACIVAFSSIRFLPNVDRDVHHDWGMFFRPRALAADPYERPAAYPPWVFAGLLPLAVLPVHLGYGLLVTLSILIIIKYTGKWWRALLLILCQPVMETLYIGQIDALLILAFMVPREFGLLVATFKPQVMLMWGLRKSWIEGTVIVCGITTLSLLIWPTWPARVSGAELSWGRNIASPYLIPVGVLLALQQNELLWLIGGALISPLLFAYHLTPILAYVFKRERWWVLVLVTLSTWAVTAKGI